MKRMGLWKAGAVSLACLGMLIPTPLLHSALAASGNEPGDPAAAVPADVALADGGRLLGQAVDATGRPLSETSVAVTQADREVAATQADAQGRFAVTGLRGGIYRVTAGQAEGVYRLWAPGTAPPSAQPAALVVAGDGQQVLGQSGPLGYWLCCNPWIVAGLVAAAIAIPVAIHNHQIDRNEAPVSP